jgi:hypothetical protein
LDAFGDFLRAGEYAWRPTHDKDDNVKARQWLEKTITLDSKYAEAYASPGSFIGTPLDQDIFGNIDNSSTLFENTSIRASRKLTGYPDL